jgi:hypothetical protein
MKYTTLALAILMAVVATARAESQIPPQYHGEWCDVRSDESKSVLKRCRDRYANADGGLQINARYYDALETRHVPTKISRYKNGHKIETTWTHDTGEKGTSLAPQYWRLSPDGRRLVIEYLGEER